MKLSKSYIMASVSLTIALMTHSAMAGHKGNFKFNGSGMKMANVNRSIVSNNVNRNLTKRVSSQNSTPFKTSVKLGPKVVQSTPKSKALNPSFVRKLNGQKQTFPTMTPGKKIAVNGNPFKPAVPTKGNGSPLWPGKGTITPVGNWKPIDPGIGNGGTKPTSPGSIKNPGKLPPFFPTDPKPTFPGTIKDPGKLPPFFPTDPKPTWPGTIKDPGKLPPFFPTDPKPPFPGTIKDPGKLPPFFPTDPKPPTNPPVDPPTNPPVDPPTNPPVDPPTNPCPPPYCPPQNPGYCGGGYYPLPFPFPGGYGGGYGGGYCGTTTVVQPVYPAGQTVATAGIVDEQVAAADVDLELLEVRQIDTGDPARTLGPAYRLVLRNKSGLAVTQAFNVALAASIGRQATADSAFAVQRVEGMQAGQMLTVEVRLPAKAYDLGRNANGQPVPFAYLTAVVDSHQELVETDRDNDYMVLDRDAIVMVAQK